MGQVFQRTYKAADGTLKTCKTWTIRWYRAGRPHEEATKFPRKGDALNQLKLRNGDIAKGKPITAAQFKLTFDDAAQTVLNDYTTNGRRSLNVVQCRIDKHLKPYFGGRRLTEIGADHVLAYIAHRQQQGIVNKKGERIGDVSNAQINRELEVLKRCFSLALEDGKVFSKPHIAMLKEAAPRPGFLGREQVDAICSHLSTELAAVIRFAFITGWRIPSEVLTLEWRQVDLKAGCVRLEPGMAKNGEGREFKFTAELRTLLETRWTEHERLKKAGEICPLVFVRLVAKGRRGPKSPKPIQSFMKRWRRACVLAGCPGRIPHDLRRSAVRTFVRAGVTEHVAMKLSGHKTPSVFRRYNIISAADLSEAAAKLDAANPDSIVTVGHSAAQGAVQTA